MILPDNHKCSLGKSSSGFSLLELLVVLILLGFTAALAGPSVGHFMNTLAFKKQTGRVMSVVRYARLIAVTKGKPVLMRVNDDAASLSFSGAINNNRDIGLSGDDTIVLEPEIIRFSPDGHATPGVIKFSKGEMSQKIVIDPLSGLPVLQFDED